MKSITKRDIADIVLVWMTISFLFMLLTSIITLGSIIGLHGEEAKLITKPVAITFQIIQIVVLMVVNYILVFKRHLVLDIVFPQAGEKVMAVPDGLITLTSYGFWIRMLGIFTFLSSGTEFLSELISDVAITRDFMNGIWMLKSGSKMISAIISLLIIWKADWLAEKLGGTGSANKEATKNGNL